MNAATPGPDPELRDRYVRWLDELAEIGMGLAREAGQQGLADGGVRIAEASLKFSRISRMVRQVIALATGIADGTVTIPADPVRTGAQNPARPAASTGGSRGHDGLGVDLDGFGLEAFERLDDQGLIDAIRGGASVEAVVMSICLDFGVTLDRCRQTDEVLVLAVRLRRVREDVEASVSETPGPGATPPPPLARATHGPDPP